MRTDRRLVSSAVVFLVCGLILIASLAIAQDNRWDGLDSATQELLAPWRDNWTQLADGERDRLLRNARRWQGLDKTQRDALLKHAAQWQSLPPQERARLRARYAAWEALTADEKMRVHAAALHFVALPPAQQDSLRASFAGQEANQQTAWLLGPSIGGWIEQASALFAFVPEGDREATLKMLKALPVDTRTQLFVLAGRLPADRRELLRKELVAADPAQRAALVNQRMSR